MLLELPFECLRFLLYFLFFCDEAKISGLCLCYGCPNNIGYVKVLHSLVLKCDIVRKECLWALRSVLFVFGEVFVKLGVYYLYLEKFFWQIRGALFVSEEVSGMLDAYYLCLRKFLAD